jgi:acyl-CoA thioester hydrolase
MEQQEQPDRFVAYLRVRHYEMDVLGHVNNAVYLHYLEQAAVEHSEHLGLTLADYERLGGIFIMRKLEIDFMRPAVAGDLLAVSTWVHEMRGARAMRKYEIAHADRRDILVQATAVWAWIERATGRPRPIPAAVLELFRRPITDQAPGEPGQE